MCPAPTAPRIFFQLLRLCLAYPGFVKSAHSVNRISNKMGQKALIDLAHGYLFDLVSYSFPRHNFNSLPLRSSVPRTQPLVQ